MAAGASGHSTIGEIMIGEILDGKYRIDKQLGAGGMGNVYLATHLWTTRVVAVKVIAPRWAADPQFLARFQREAQACGRLRHPNIVNVTDFGIARSGRADMPYLVMEFLDGETLSDYQKAHSRIALPVVADLLDQIGLALAEANRYGIVHRDLKPDNIWLEPNGRGGHTVKVLDFGVAKLNLLGGWAAPVKGAADAAAAASLPPAAGGPLESVAAVALSAAAGSQLEPGAASPSPPAPSAPLEPAATAALPAILGDELETALIPSRPEETETVAMALTPSPAPSAFDSGAGGQTMPGSLIGTPAYMSPEQALGKEIDFRSDIYSLAVVAYSLVCGQLPFTGKTGDYFEFHRTGNPLPPASIQKLPRDVSDAVLAGLARDPADRPASAVEFTRRFHNAVDGEFFAMRRSKAFLLQHLAPFAFLLGPIYGGILAVTALLATVARKLLPDAGVRLLVVPLAAAVFFVFADNVLRAAAALMAMDEQVRVRRFLSFRVFWKLTKTMPVLAMTQARSLFFFGPGWLVGDCLWPVICTVEQLSGKAAIERSRRLMTGLRSAGRALAIRHLALPAIAIADLMKSLGVLWRSGHANQPNEVITAGWFPVFAIFAAAPLFLFDRTAARETGPLLQLDRTPEVRITARPLSVSSLIWLVLGAAYLLYQPIRFWLFGGR